MNYRELLGRMMATKKRIMARNGLISSGELLRRFKTLSEGSEKTGVSVPTLSRVKRGSVPRKTIKDKLASHFGLNSDQIAWGVTA